MSTAGRPHLMTCLTVSLGLVPEEIPAISRAVLPWFDTDAVDSRLPEAALARRIERLGRREGLLHRPLDADVVALMRWPDAFVAFGCLLSVGGIPTRSTGLRGGRVDDEVFGIALEADGSTPARWVELAPVARPLEAARRALSGHVGALVHDRVTLLWARAGGDGDGLAHGDLQEAISSLDLGSDRVIGLDPDQLRLAWRLAVRLTDGSSADG
jgi:hypothetical protein